VTLKSTTDLVDLAQQTLFPNYRQFPVVFERGAGNRLWDVDGNEYLDFVAGIATCNLGHCHPAVTAAISEQAKKLVHVSNWYYNKPQLELAERLTGLSSLERVFFCNSGAEASEMAIKLARKRAFEKYGTNRNLVISLFGAFHGRTMKALTATDPKHHNEAFSPYPEGFAHINRGDVTTLKEMLPGACAFLLEPVQAEGGVYPLEEGFMLQAADLCREHDVLLILDEVQTGMGRCGANFAHQLYNIKPDVMTLAKGLANGFPIGAVLANSEAASVMEPGTHGSTFGGNPLASAAACATLQVLEDQELSRHARELGNHFTGALEDLVSRIPGVVEVRGRGLLLGLEIKGSAADCVLELLKRGYLVTVVQEHTIRFTPPLTVSEGEIDQLIKALEEVLTEQEDGGS